LNGPEFPPPQGERKFSCGLRPRYEERDAMRKTRILLIEDDPTDRRAFQRFADDEAFPYGYATAGSITDARGLLKSEDFDCIIADYRLGDGTAFDILELNLEVPVIITTGAGSEQIAVQAMKAGAQDYLIKDDDRNYLKVLQVTIEGALKQKRTEERIKIQSERESGKAVILGGEGGMAEVFRLIEIAASSNSPVFITGKGDPLQKRRPDGAVHRDKLSQPSREPYRVGTLRLRERGLYRRDSREKGRLRNGRRRHPAAR
jgi:ActR/RegA family two-component response regulator